MFSYLASWWTVPVGCLISFILRKSEIGIIMHSRLEKGMAIHSSILAWRIPWTEESGRPQFMWSERVGHDWAINTTTTTTHIKGGGGIGRGDQFLPYKFIKRTLEHWANSTKQLLIASRGHQVPRKAALCLRKEVGQNIKDKKRDKRARDGDPSWEGNHNRGSFQTPGNYYHAYQKFFSPYMFCPEDSSVSWLSHLSLLTCYFRNSTIFSF